MRRSPAHVLSLLLALLALGATGCSSDDAAEGCTTKADCDPSQVCNAAGRCVDAPETPPDPPDAGLPPAIRATELPPAYVGKAYSVTAEVQGGTAPYTWSLGQPLPAGLAWLQVDAPTGTLRGTPPAAAAQASFELRVADAQARTDAQTLALAVLACASGDTAACLMPVGGACRVGTQACADGSFGTCVVGAQGSTDVGRCGPTCSPCGPGANACTDGQCACGTGAACAATGATTCCGTGTGASCVDTQTDVQSCGACGRSCTDPDGDGTDNLGANVTATCSAGTCGYACQTGFDDCDGLAATGCETRLDSLAHCGACGRTCGAPANGTPACVQGTCGIQACNPGFGNCDGNPATGCETNVNSNVNHCGTCGRNCAAQFTVPNPHATTTCAGGTCGLVCESGWDDCDGRFDNGCEANLDADERHCGQCGRSCGSGGVCNGGDCCAQCPSGTLCCAPRVCSPQGSCSAPP